MESTLEKKIEQEQSPSTEQGGFNFRERLEAGKATYRKPAEQSREVLAEAARCREARKKPKLPAKDEKRGDVAASCKSAVTSSRPTPEAEAAPEGERNYDWPPCLRCMGKNLPCSFVHNRSAGSDLVCTCCERLGQGVFCIQFATARAGRYYGVDEVTSVWLWPAGWRSDDVTRQLDAVEVFVPIPDLRYLPDEYEAFVQTAEFLVNGEPSPMVADRLGDGLMLADVENWVLPLWWKGKETKKLPPGTDKDEEKISVWQGYFRQLQRQRKDRRDEENQQKVKEYRAQIQKRRRLQEDKQAHSTNVDVAKVGDDNTKKEKEQTGQESSQKKEPEAEPEDSLAYTPSARVLQYLCREREKMKKYGEAFEQAKKEEEAKMAEAERMAKRGLLQIDYDSAPDGATDSSSTAKV
ncbi:hypothetical protein MCOR24_010448 [Pyricularia oryzae]|nr:hypothetical protein MCOR24_010448 [Pyricularia oryzae]